MTQAGREALWAAIPDPTSNNLAAALFDQNCAGTFHGKSYAFVPVHLDGAKWGAGVAVANERGYTPSPFEFEDHDEAGAFCDGMNKHIGLSQDEAFAIMASTMGGRRYAKQ